MDHDSIPEIALDWHRSGRGATIATVIQTWGSAPRPAGSQLVVAGDGAIMGSVSGGCVEGAVIHEAADARNEGRARVIEFGVSDADAFAVGLACGGTIRILIEPVGTALPEDHLAALVAARAARRAVAHLVNLSTWETRLSGPGDAELGAAIAARMASDQAGVEGDWFIAVHNPPLRLIVVGAVHIAQPLVAMARMAGYDPVIIDPRATFGAAERFRGETILELWPDEAMEAQAPDPRTAIVTLTHDPKLDDPALQVALRSQAFYVGSLGSTRTHAKRLERLRASGLTEADLARLHAPVGLAIGARTPSEIAISILAEMTARLRQG
ncbi:XdhC family protein [Halodurantibacterium flavum]|uniref:XdhC family protein n=1 Tax=Halodurantibacterium flavum TaxID=1382802 RepID=A0ABW4S4M1_9RHOB